MHQIIFSVCSYQKSMVRDLIPKHFRDSRPTFFRNLFYKQNTKTNRDCLCITLTLVCISPFYIGGACKVSACEGAGRPCDGAYLARNQIRQLQRDGVQQVPKGSKTVGVKGPTTVPLPDQSQYLPIHEPRKMAAHTGRIRSYIMGKVMDEKANRGMKLIYNTDTLSLFFNVCLCMRDHM